MRIVQTITRNEQVAGDRPAVTVGDHTRTWSEMRDRVARLAAGLRDLGVGEGDRVAMLALNSDRYLEWFFAVSWAGAVFVPLNIRLAPPEMAHWLTDSGSSVLFVDDAFLPALPGLRDQVESLEHVVHVGDGGPPAGLLGYEQLLDSAEPVAPSERGGDDLAGLFYTGGTTGVSKGVRLSHDNLLTNSLQVLPLVGIDGDTVYLHTAPMFHLANASVMFCVALAGAGNVTTVPAFDPPATLEAIERHRVTMTTMVPAMITALLQVPGLEERELSSLRTLAYGAAPMAENTIEAVQKALPHVELLQAYGQTEAGPVLTMLTPERHAFSGPLAGKTRSAGQAVYAVEIEILDEHDHPVPRGTVGEICARGNNIMLGYHGRPEATAEALRGGWLHTGDAGYLDDHGFVFVVDRLKDMIVTGGENVYSAEVENALVSHPSVIEAAVFGIPSQDWGEQVHAVITTAPGDPVTADEVIDHCRKLVAGYKAPKSVEIRNEELPKSGAGKIVKRDLRAPHWEHLDRAIS